MRGVGAGWWLAVRALSAAADTGRNRGRRVGAARAAPAGWYPAASQRRRQGPPGRADRFRWSSPIRRFGYPAVVEQTANYTRPGKFRRYRLPSASARIEGPIAFKRLLDRAAYENRATDVSMTVGDQAVGLRDPWYRSVRVKAHPTSASSVSSAVRSPCRVDSCRRTAVRVQAPPPTRSRSRCRGKRQASSPPDATSRRRETRHRA